MNEFDNDERIRQYKKNNLFKWITVGLSIVVIILEILALMNKISMLWGCGIFLIVLLLKKLF